MKNQRILLGVTGGIAAYKSAYLLRMLKKRGIKVRVVMTHNAGKFITPLTFKSLGARGVYTTFAGIEDRIGHIKLARWANEIIIAPATANFIAKLAHGLGDDLISTVCLASSARINIAPAMNRLMWENSATQSNIEILKQRGINILEPAAGAQACGEEGDGRMLEPENIIARLLQAQILAGKKIMITAGPTREPLDPVRFISNRSSGKMGYALAAAAVQMGAEVCLVSGPTALSPPSGAELIAVETCKQMGNAVLSRAAEYDWFIGCAAVADFRLVQIPSNKIKKEKSRGLKLELIPNPDIISEVAQIKQGPLIIGFAAETENLTANAREKLKSKNMDIIIANKVGDKVGFEADENEVIILGRNSCKKLARADKKTIAREILQTVYHYQKS